MTVKTIFITLVPSKQREEVLLVSRRGQGEFDTLTHGRARKCLGNHNHNIADGNHRLGLLTLLHRLMHRLPLVWGRRHRQGRQLLPLRRG